MTAEIHIIEPTLNRPGGHCFTVAHALIDAARQSFPDLKIHLWCGKHFPDGLIDERNVSVHRFFRRRSRRFQLWSLLVRLRGSERVCLLPTAGRPELAIYAMVPKQARRHLRVWFYVHQLRMDPSRTRKLRMLASRVPEARILCTHDRILGHLKNAGFKNVRIQPCPFVVPERAFEPAPFRHLIAPGEARPDKNLAFLAELIDWLGKKGEEIPFLLQAAPNHHGFYAPDVERQLNFIERAKHPWLTVARAALDENDYLDQFRGAICLQPYRPEDYAEKISGITLDALARGAPCIASEGTWPAEVIREFDAGIVCPPEDVDAWGKAIQHAVHRYERFQQQCRKAFSVLAERHHPKRTIETILETG